MKATFEPGRKYGNEFTIEVIKRTAKFLTIKTVFGTNRVKIRDCYQNAESISFKAWLIDATEAYNEEEAVRLSYERAYYN